MSRAVEPTTLRQMDRLADLMSENCPSITEAAYRMRMTQSRVDQLWQRIRRQLGPQAR